MTLNVLLAYSITEDRDFKEYTMGKKYLKEFTHIVDNLIREKEGNPNIEFVYFKNVYKDESCTAGYKPHTLISTIADNYAAIDKSKIDYVAFLINDHHGLRGPDPILILEQNLCDYSGLPYFVLSLDDIVAEVKRKEERY